MARNRTHDEILDQVVYAAAAAIAHYGPALSAEGLHKLRTAIDSCGPFHCDSTWRVDVLEGPLEENPDFCPQVLPDRQDRTFLESFVAIVRQSRFGDESDI